MRTQRNQILAAVGLAALALAVPLSTARAQEGSTSTKPAQEAPEPQQGGQFGGPGAPPPPGPGGFQGQPGQMRQGIGGTATMVLDNTHLYILRGNTLYKVNKADLKVQGTGELPMPQPPGGPARGGG